jgi:hypothetical protein
MKMKLYDQTHLVDKTSKKLKCMPLKLSGRLICGSFGWNCVVEMHPKKVKA